MTVNELIKVLTQIEDQETRVMVRGYEGGVDDIKDKTPAIENIALDVNDKWYYGRHERVDDMYDSTNNNYQIVKAIIL